MKIRMLKHVNGTVNGVRMGPFVLGLEYAVPEEITVEQADLFLGSAMAEEVVVQPLEFMVAETVTPEAEPL